jgi:hypothetical protein
MPHGPEHHLEEAEHAQHASHSPFDRRVTLTMAIVAALLACVTMLSHRAHNQTLQNQIKSNDNITERANVFAYYQAKKNRQLMDEAFAELLETMGDDKQSAARAKTLGQWRANAAKWKDDAKKLESKGNKLSKEIEKYAEEAHRHHYRANFFDYGELGVELSLILCSISLLTKNGHFWFAGLAAAALGCVVAVCGFLIPPPHDHPSETEESVASSSGGGGAAATANLDKRVDAQGDEDGAQQRHGRQARAAHALDLAFADQRHRQPSGGGEEAEDAEQGGGVHRVFEEALLERQQAEYEQSQAHDGGNQGRGA